MQKVTFQVSKSISDPQGHRVIVDYVHIDKILLGCKGKICIASVKEKFELILQNAPNSIYPTPIGEWKGDRFMIIDGRHLTIAYMIHGYEYILVSWMEKSQK